MEKVAEKKTYDVIKMSDYPYLFRGFLFHFSSHLPNFYDVTFTVTFQDIGIIE